MLSEFYLSGGIWWVVLWSVCFWRQEFQFCPLATIRDFTLNLHLIRSWNFQQSSSYCGTKLDQCLVIEINKRTIRRKLSPPARSNRKNMIRWGGGHNWSCANGNSVFMISWNPETQTRRWGRPEVVWAVEHAICGHLYQTDYIVNSFWSSVTIIVTGIVSTMFST